MNPIISDAISYLAEKVVKEELTIPSNKPILKSFQTLLWETLFSKEGFIFFDLPHYQLDTIGAKKIAGYICQLAGTPLFLEKEGPFWQPLMVKLEAAHNRTHGIGKNPFHIDYVNRQHPPDLIAFLGVRSDPLGGGYTELADMTNALKILSNSEQALLKQPIFQYWKDIGAQQVGKHLNRYAILDEEQNVIRFTAKMLPHLDGSDTVLHLEALGQTKQIRTILLKFYEALNHHKVRVLVGPSQLLLFNQCRLAHARMPLGQGQDELHSDLRRRLLQGYIRRVKHEA